MSVRSLATNADFSPSFISQVENGQVSPSISSLERIALALGASISDFFQHADREGAAGLVVRASQRRRYESAWSKAQIENLGVQGSKLRPLLITVAPHGSSGKKPYRRPYDEFAFVLEGAIKLELNGEEIVLETGDAASTPAQKPVRWVNESDRPAKILVVSAGESNSYIRVREHTRK